MSRWPARSLAVVAAFLFAATMQAAPTPIYNSVPAPLAPNYPSLGFQATGTAELGDLIQFAGTTRTLSSVTILLSDWAIASDYGSSSPTWSHPITLNLYNVDNSGPTPEPGTLIATNTQTFAIPWRPAADPTCANPTFWRASDGNCYGGLTFAITFDMSGVVVPNQIIYGVAFNTQTYGAAPIGSAGPYNSLNVALPNNPPNPTVGTNPLPDTKYWNTVAANYTDGGAAGSGIFRQDTGWTPFTLGAEFVTADADLAVTKTGPATVIAGSDITYSVTVTNGGPSDAQGVTLTDVVPTGTTFVSETQNSGPSFVCTNPLAGATGTVSCSIATLTSGSTAVFTLVFHASPALAGGTTVANTATVASTTPDSGATNNSSTSNATVIASSAVPTLGPLAIALLAITLTAFGMFVLRH